MTCHRTVGVVGFLWSGGSVSCLLCFDDARWMNIVKNTRVEFDVGEEKSEILCGRDPV